MTVAGFRSEWTTIRLVAAREIRERSRTKAFRISAVVLLIGAVVIAAFPALINSTTTYRVGVVGEVAPVLDENLHQAAADRDAEVEITSYPDVSTGDEAVSSGQVDVLYDPGAGQLVWHEEANPTLASLVIQATVVARVDQVASSLDLSPAELERLQAPPDLTSRSLETVDADRGTRIAVALAGTILLFVAIQVFGGFVLSGVVEEKTTRIAEVLLAQVRPDSLLAGKVLGIGLLALAELVVVVLAALVTGQLAGTIPLPAIGAGAAATIIGWFILGFAFYAVLFGSAGALVDRQDDAQVVLFPIMAPLIAGYVFVLSTVTSPDNVGTTILSFVPLTSAVAMPMRMQLGAAPVWQVVVSVLIMVATMVVLLRLAGRVYAGGLLRTGARVRVRDALASADDLRLGR